MIFKWFLISSLLILLFVVGNNFSGGKGEIIYAKTYGSLFVNGFDYELLVVE